MAKDDILPGSDKFVSPSMAAAEKNAINLDPATHLAERRGQFLEIFHIPSGQSIKFKAYIDDFQDKYDSEWNSTDVFGRMDPLHQYQGTKRVISLDWIVPSFSVAEAKHHHDKCALLFSMLYPTYNSNTPGSATQISTAPVFKVKFGIIDIKLALPHLSPRPLMVPCICLAPHSIAAKELATAFSVSLCA